MSGEIVELPLPRVHTSECFIYETTSLATGKLTVDQPCGPFLDRLLATIFAKPGYLREEDINRYASLTLEFKTYVYDLNWNSQKPSPVAELPIRQLGFALRDWVESVLRTERFSLMPTLALDAARVIEAHAWGRQIHQWGQPSWTIKPLIDRNDEQRGRDLDNARLKREITSAFAGLLVRMCIPDGSRIRHCRTNDVVAEAGIAYFAIERCHLSSGINDYTDLEVEEDNPPVHDIASEFMLRGRLWPAEAVEAQLRKDADWPFKVRNFGRLEIPGRWIDAWLTQQHTWQSVPNWNSAAPP